MDLRLEREQMRRGNRQPWSWLLLAIALFASRSADAQGGRPFREMVTIAVDAEATRTLQILEDRWAAGEWQELVETLVNLSETRGNRVVNFVPGTTGQTARYGLVQSACDRLIAALPPDGLAAYRRRVDAAAERWFRDWQSTGDVNLLERVIRQAYYSSWGDDALWELGELAWESGDFQAAYRWWSQLLPEQNGAERRDRWELSTHGFLRPSRRYPDPSQPAADAAARCALCVIFAGDAVRARAAVAEFAAAYPEAEGELAGRRARWQTLLDEVLAASRQWPQTDDEVDEAPTFGGTAARTIVSPRTVDLGSELWSVPLTPVRLPEVARVTLFPPALPLAYHPAVADGRVFVNEGRRILAWDLATGRPAWGEHSGSAVIYPAVEDELPQTPARSVSGGPSWTVTIADGRLFARMGSAVTTPSPHELRDLPNEIVCLDIAEGQGRLLWKRTGEDLSAALHEPPGMPLWSWEGTPLAQDGRIYAALSRRRPQLEWSIACLDADTGLLLWHRAVGISRPAPPEHENRASQLLLTLGDGWLFLSTDWGAVVAVDSAEGQLQWAATYESQPYVASAAMPAPRVASAPCVYAGGRLFVAPLDCDRVFCFEARTGERLWQRQTDERLTSLIGVSQGRLLASGRSLWAFSVESGAPAWSIPQVEPDDYGYGRGWLADDVVYWTSRQALYAFHAQTGQLLRERPFVSTNGHRTGGNLVVASGIMLIASGDRLTAYGQFVQPPPPRPDVLSQRRPMALPQRSVSRSAALPPLSTPPRTASAPAGRSEFRAPNYWQRAWHTVLAPGERVLATHAGTPAGPPLVLCAAKTVQARDALTGEIRWELPLDDSAVWSTDAAIGVIVGTGDELCAVDPSNGRVQWRLPWRAALSDSTESPTDLTFHLLEHGVLVVALPLGFVWCDEFSGQVRLVRTFSPHLHPQTASVWKQRLVLWSRRWGRKEEWDFREGTPRRTTALTPFAWAGSPYRDADNWLLTTNDRRLIWTTDDLQPLREYVAVAYAHADPLPIPRQVPGDRESNLLLDGTTLVRLRWDGEHIWSLWSQPLVRAPLTEPREQIAVLNDRIYAAAGGLLQAFDLQTGQAVWRQVIALPDPLRVVAGPGCVAVAPLPPAPPVFGADLFDARTGEPWQRIGLSSGARRVELQPHPAGLVVATDREAIGLVAR